MAYCTRSDVELIWGTSNISKWANADNTNDVATPAAITARIAWAIEAVDAMIDDRLRRKWYDLPFADVPVTIKNLSATMVGIKLYESPRGLVDGDEANEAITNKKEECERIIVNILGGIIKLDVAHTVEYIPEAVEVDITDYVEDRT